MTPETALVDIPAKLHKGKGSVLRPPQVAALVQLHKLAKTQTEIAQILGCDQSTVSRWLEHTTDTRDAAAAYLHGQALPLAQKAVRKATASDAVKLLGGIGVIGDGSSGAQVLIQIGGLSQDVTVGVRVSPRVSVLPGETSENP